MTPATDLSDTLVFLPTYNEAGTVRDVYAMVRAELPDADILFIDDSSPDGTGAILDAMTGADPRLQVIHRPGKLGIGSAHRDAINMAYNRGYRLLLTMDSDLAHSPHYIREFLALSVDYPVVVGTRFEMDDSLAGWNAWRKLLTLGGHMLTRFLLGIRQDATGAFRAYRLDRIPRATFSLVRACDYAFFFESLHVLMLNGFDVGEVRIQLPPRTYGTSKMRIRDVAAGFIQLLSQAVRVRARRQLLLLPRESTACARGGGTGSGAVQAEWDRYWSGSQRAGAGIYDAVAALCRRLLIRPALDRALARSFAPGARLLHAGCGGGQADENAVSRFRVTAIDISPVALARYGSLQGRRVPIVCADLFRLPFPDGAFEGLYNLGVMEHFTSVELDRVLSELRRVLHSSGCMVLFWPPRFGFSVLVLRLVHFIRTRLLRRQARLHPAEPSLLRSRRATAELLARNGLVLEAFRFGPGDLFLQVVVVARPADGRQ
jgi:dolichol-phosphate mannosyltransferase